MAEPTQNPIWNATFDFPNVPGEELMDKTIEVTLWDYCPDRDSVFLGECPWLSTVSLYQAGRQNIGNPCAAMTARYFAKYRGDDKSLAQPDCKKKLKVRHFLSDAEVITAAQTWLDGKLSELSLSGLQKLQFGRCRLFLSWSG